MNASKPRTLILAGEGIHCEQETALAFRMAGFEAEIRHLNDLITERMTLDELSRSYQAFAIPGGASFSHDLLSGKVLALKLSHKLGWNLDVFAERGGVVIGISNGFQVLVRMGVFGRDLSIAPNSDGRFVDTWIKATPNGNRCIWLKGLGTLDLPVRHSEGQVIISASRRTEIVGKMERHGMMCLRYEGDTFQSEERLAGICDFSGRIFGLMPQPETFLRWTSHPEWTSQTGRATSPGQGLALFENAYQEVLRSKG